MMNLVQSNTQYGVLRTSSASRGNYSIWSLIESENEKIDEIGLFESAIHNGLLNNVISL